MYIKMNSKKYNDLLNNAGKKEDSKFLDLDYTVEIYLEEKEYRILLLEKERICKERRERMKVLDAAKERYHQALYFPKKGKEGEDELAESTKELRKHYGLASVAPSIFGE